MSPLPLENHCEDSLGTTLVRSKNKILADAPELTEQHRITGGATELEQLADELEAAKHKRLLPITG